MCLAFPSRFESEKQFVKELGRNVYALGIGFQKLRELKVTHLNTYTRHSFTIQYYQVLSIKYFYSSWSRFLEGEI